MNLYSTITDPTGRDFTDARNNLLGQPEVARKSPMRDAIRAARTGMQWAQIAQWFHPGTAGQRIANEVLATVSL